MKSLPANPWGLYEVHGNVREWCSDGYQADLGSGPVIDPQGPAPSSDIWPVTRGGSFAGNAPFSRSACRYSHAPGDRITSQGFRLAAPRQPTVIPETDG